MTAYVIALGILMVLWLMLWQPILQQVQRHRALAGSSYLTVLLLWSSIGWAILAGLSWRYLPASVLSMGWAMEDIAAAKYNGLLLTAMMVIFAVWYWRAHWLPANNVASLKASIRKPASSHKKASKPSDTVPAKKKVK